MKKRWLYLVVGAVVALFLGLIYAWSLFVSPIETDLGFTRADTAMTFTISMSFFAIGNLAGSFILKKWSTRATMAMSAVLIAVGFIACASISSLAGLFLSYGVALSLGVGICYISIMNTVNRWFTDRVGTASGVLLMSFGLGSLVLGGTARTLFDVMGWRTTFIALGIVFAAMIVVAALILRAPTPEQVKELTPSDAGKSKGKTVSTDEFPPSRMIKVPAFWFFFLWCVLMMAAGLAAIGNAATFAGSIGTAVSMTVLATGTISACNGLGRLVFGSLFDVIGYRRCMLLDAVLFIIGMALLIVAGNSSALIFLFAGYVCAGLALGGVPVTNSALTMSFFGAKNYATNFSIMALSIIPGALLGPYLAGVLVSSGMGYSMAFTVMLVISIVAAVTGLAIRPPKGQKDAACPSNQTSDDAK